MNEVTIFENAEFGEVRTSVIENEVWFCLADICRVLELTTPAKVKSRLNESGVNSIHVGVQTGIKADGSPSIQTVNMTFINEPNLYKTIFQSRKPEAEKFGDRVTSEVLPSIRKHGGYILGQEEMEPEMLLSKALLFAQSKINNQAELISKLQDKIESDKPFTEFAKQVSRSKDSIDIGDLAKLVKNENIDIGRNRLFSWLRDRKFLMDSNMPYQRYINNNYFEVIEIAKNTVYGTKIFLKTLVTGKGQIAIIERLRNEFVQ